MRLWFMKHVVNPSETLLDPEVPPLGLGHEVGLGDELGEVLGQHHVSILVLVVSVLVTVVNIFLGHPDYFFTNRINSLGNQFLKRGIILQIS